MPRYYRRARRRYGTATRRRYSYYRRGRRGIRRRSIPAVPGRRKNLTFKWINSYAPTITIPTGQSVAAFGFALNDLHYFHRNTIQGATTTAATTPTQLPSKSEWFQFYQHWKVHRVDFRITVFNENTLLPFYVGYVGYTTQAANTPLQSFPGPAGTPGTTTWSDMMELSRANRFNAAKLVGTRDSSKAMVTLRMRIPIAKMAGNKNYRTDEDYAGGSTAGAALSPLLVYTGYVFVATTRNNNTVSDQIFTVSARAKIYTSLYSPFWEVT